MCVDTGGVCSRALKRSRPLDRTVPVISTDTADAGYELDYHLA